MEHDDGRGNDSVAGAAAEAAAAAPNVNAGKFNCASNSEDGRVNEAAHEETPADYYQGP